MANLRTLLTAPALLVGLWTAAPAQAFTDPQADSLIRKFLASKKTSQADAQENGRAIADLNGDGEPELVLVWAQLGATYFTVNLTLFVDEGTKYRSLTAPVKGEAKLVGVRGRLIVIEEKTLGPKDPRCCPSVVAQTRYRWTGQKLQIVR